MCVIDYKSGKTVSFPTFESITKKIDELEEQAAKKKYSSYFTMVCVKHRCIINRSRDGGYECASCENALTSETKVK